MRVLVTGGAGYVGIALMRALLADSRVDQIVVYDNLSRRHYELFFAGTVDSAGRVRFVEGDILDGRTLDRVAGEVDVLYHLAARVTTPNSDLDAHAVDQVNNWGAAQVARAAEKSDALRRLVYVSSTAVYPSSIAPFAEQTRTEPSSIYGLSKLRGEQHFLRLHEPLVQVVRAANVFGFSPAMRFDAVVNKMAFEARFLRRVTVHGAGDQTRPFVHVDRLAAALVSLLDLDDDGVFIAADHNRSVTEIVQALRLMAPDLEVLYIDQDAPMRRSVALLPTSLMGRLGPRPDFEAELGGLYARLKL